MNSECSELVLDYSLGYLAVKKCIFSAALLHYATVHISHIFGNVSNFIFEFMNSECSKLVLDYSPGYLTDI